MKVLKSSTGFTIVELLVSIVIIGILATVAVNAVSDAIDRASNVRTIAGISSYRDAIIAYGLENNDYPWQWNSCVGVGYEDVTGDGIGDCVWPESRAWGTAENATFVQPLADILGTSEIINDDVHNWFSERTAGAVLLYDDFDNFRIDGQWADNRHFLRYHLNGHETNCGFDTISYTTGLTNEFIRNSGNPYSLTSSSQDTTLCIVELPGVGPGDSRN